MAFYYNGVTKVYIIAFSKLFSGLQVQRKDELDQQNKLIKVPLVYASKQKLAYELAKQQEATTASIVLPVIGFSIEGMTYASNRKLNSLNELRLDNDETMYEGVPYDYQFTVNVRTKYQEDLWQILEQILYNFKPDVALDVKELTHTGWVRDVKVTLNAVTFENELELTQDEASQRQFIATLDCTLNGFIYPNKAVATLIEHVDINFDSPDGNQIINISADWVDPNIVTTITEI